MGKEEDEKEKIVPTVWDRFDKLERQIAELRESDLEQEEHIQRLEGCVSDCQEEINELKERLDKHNVGIKFFSDQSNLNKEVLRDFYKHKLDKADYTIECLSSKEHVAEKMVDYVKNDIIFYKKQLETLDTPKQTEKKEIPSENLRTCSECQKIFESIKLRKNHEHCIHGIGEFIKDSEGEKEVGEATTHKHEEGTRRPDSRPNSKPPESEKEFEFQLIEKFIPPRNIKCIDCMNNPVPKLIKEFIQKLKLLNNGCEPYPNDPLDILIKEYEGKR